MPFWPLVKMPLKKFSLKPKRKEIITEVKPKLIGKPENIEKETGNFVFSPKQIDRIEKIDSCGYCEKRL